MTTLDQAFIKAFSQQGASPTAVVPRPAEANSNKAPQAVAERTEKPAHDASAMFDRFDNILNVLEKMPNLMSEPSASQDEVVVEAEPSGNEFPSIEVTPEQWSGENVEWVVGENNLGDLSDSPEAMVPGHEPQTSIAEPQTSYPPPPVPNIELQATISEQRPIEETKESHNEESADEVAVQNTHVPEFHIPTPEPEAPIHKHEEFRPAWQVDSFTWPRTCRRLVSRAAAEWDRLADAIQAAAGHGQKVIAFAGCRRGEGATTLLLCAAQRLAERGVKTALIDADLGHPRLAKRLGVQPQIGWNETSPTTNNTMNQAVVETADGNLALASVRDSAARNGGAWSGWNNCVEQMRNHYDVVLVDVGPLENVSSDGGSPTWMTAHNIDALLMVHNLRVTAKDTLAETQQRLVERDVNVAGVIENFVAL